MQNPSSNHDPLQQLVAAAGHSKPWYKKTWLIAAILALLLLIFFLSRIGGEPAYQYQTQTLALGSLSVVVTATGNLEPTNQVDVGSEVSGTVIAVNADYNDRVEIGQILATLDTSKLEAQVLAGKASVAVAQASLLQSEATQEEAEFELQRLQQVYELSEGRMPSQSDLDAARAAVKRAQADVASSKATIAQAQASLELDQTNLDKAIIRSPISGVVLSREVDSGQTVAASLEAPVLFTLAENLAQMQLHVDVDEADVGLVKAGQKAFFTVDAYSDKSFPAMIEQVRYGAEEVDGVITYKTILNVDNSDLLLRPGMTATADITVQEVNDALLIPSAALRFAPAEATTEQTSGSLISRLMPRPPQRQNNRSELAEGEQRVWILQDGQPQPVIIRIGASDGSMTQVVSGNLQPGMQIITDMTSLGQ